MEYLLTIVAIVVGWLLGILSEPVGQFFYRKWWGPRVSVNCTREEGCLLRTNARTYLRLYVKNQGYSSAVACKGFLVLAERSCPNGYEKIPGGDDTLLLTWAYSKAEDRTSGFHLARGVGRFLDLLYADHGKRSFHLCHVSPENPAIKDVGEPGKYQFTIMISAEKSEPKLVQLVFDWTEDWDTSKICLQRSVDKTNLRS